MSTEEVQGWHVGERNQKPNTVLSLAIGLEEL